MSDVQEIAYPGMDAPWMWDAELDYDRRPDPIVDGDTVYLCLKKRVDLGFYSYMTHETIRNVRLNRIDTPEIHGVKKESDEFKAGKAAEARLEDMLTTADRIVVQTHKAGSFGRWLADIWIFQADVVIDVNYTLFVEGHATAYTKG